MQVESAAATHVGRVRTINEDSFLAYAGLAAVADGMGGHTSGDVASQLAIGELRHLLGIDPIQPDDVAAAIERANAAILDEARRNPEKDGMGTTLAGVAVVDQSGSPHWLVFNIGDSRVYRIADPPAMLTVDHSEVAELVASGEITAQAARTHPLRHVITRSLGSVTDATADMWLLPVCDGDLLLICSDGLTGEVEESDIAQLVDAATTLDEAVAALVQAALDRGGHDNVTVILVRASLDLTAGGVAAQTVPRAGLGQETP